MKNRLMAFHTEKVPAAMLRREAETAAGTFVMSGSCTGVRAVDVAGGVG
ncbi:hypothetical protein [Segatella buccae]|nr:hypothetical protein [Segatella buccae]